MKAMKIISLVCRCVVVSLLVVAFLLLFVEGVTTYKTESWGVANSNNQRVDLDAEWDYSNHNFFERMDRVSSEGFGVEMEFLFLALFGAALAVVVVSFFVKHLRPFYFSVFTLLLFVFCILLALEADTWYMIDSEYLGTLYGYRVYQGESMRFGISYIPQIVLVSSAFAIQFAGGMISFILARKEKALEKAMSEQVEEAPAVADVSNDSFVAVESPVTVLSRYKELLDAGVITQEEFDEKKKQVLNL